MRRGQETQGVETLQQVEWTIVTDSRKAEVSAGVFFLDLHTQRIVEQQEIDDVWCTSRPPGFSEGIGFSSLEVITAV